MSEEVVGDGPIGCKRMNGEIVGRGDLSGKEPVRVAEEDRESLDSRERRGEGAEEIELEEREDVPEELVQAVVAIVLHCL